MLVGQIAIVTTPVRVNTYLLIHLTAVTSYEIKFKLTYVVKFVGPLKRLPLSQEMLRLKSIVTLYMI